MYGTAKEAFCKAVLQLQLPRSSTVVVGLSGGPDSVALLHLAQQTFKRVVAVTVDHRLRDESGEEAVKAGRTARQIGAEHKIVSLDWEKERERRPTIKVPSGSQARLLRYGILMKECQRLNGDVLMVGHHANDQIETMLHRLMMSSGLIGLGGMQLVSYWAVNPKLPIIRPLLNCSKSSLIELCSDMGLQWVNDPSNEQPTSIRNRVRPIIAQHSDLIPGLMEIVSLCREAKRSTHPKVEQAMERLAKVHPNYGILSFDTGSYKRLNPFVARSVLAIWLRYIGSSGNTVNRRGLERLHNIITQDKIFSNTLNNSILIPVPKEKRFLIAKQKPMAGRIQKMPIRVGQTILWDNRLKISLFARKSPGTGGQKTDRSRDREDVKNKVFYVRNFVMSDNLYATKGLRKIKGTVLLHHHVRGGLPVITDDNDNIVLIPHFKVIRHSVGVDCSVTFAPTWTMKQLLNFHYISDDSTHPITHS